MNRRDFAIWIILILIVIFIFGLFMLAVAFDGKEQTRKDNTCKSIGEKKNLEFYWAGHGKCGWGYDCSFQCKFINPSGETEIHHVK